MRYRDWLKLPLERGEVDEDAPETTVRRARTIRGKPFLRRLYLDFYKEMQRAVEGCPGDIVELGSGGGFIKEVIPQAITSDVLELPGLDRCFSALDMPFADASVGAFCMLHVFHHVGDAHRFLTEMNRCLMPGGKIIMIEPSGTPLAGPMYTHLHQEPFDRSAGWTFHDRGPLSGANAALPWIVFNRDREKLGRDFPELEVQRFENHRPISPALSGGVSYVQFVPSSTYPIFRGLETLLSPINDLIGMLTSIELKKRS